MAAALGGLAAAVSLTQWDLSPWYTAVEAGGFALCALAGLGLAAGLHFADSPPEGLIATVSPLLPTNLATFVRLTAMATGACGSRSGSARARRPASTPR